MPRAACAFPPALSAYSSWNSTECVSRWHFRQHHIWDPTTLSRRGEAHKLLLLCYPGFPFLAGSQWLRVFHFSLKKQHAFFDDNAAPRSAASKRSRKYGATLQNTSSGKMKILQPHFWFYHYLPMGNTIGGLQCWGISTPAADLVGRTHGWCAISTSHEILIQAGPLPLCSRKQRPVIQSSG